MMSSPERAKFEQLNLKTSCLGCYNFSRQFPHVRACAHTHTQSFPWVFAGPSSFLAGSVLGGLPHVCVYACLE